MHHLHVKWSDEDQQFVGTCEEYPSLSYLADTAEAAGEGISELAYATRDDLAAGRTEKRECVCGRTFEVVTKYAKPWTVCPACVTGPPLNNSTYSFLLVSVSAICLLWGIR